MADFIYGRIDNKGLIQVDIQKPKVRILNYEEMDCYCPDKDNICTNTDSVTDEGYNEYCRNCNGCKDFLFASSEETSGADP
jgi:hypothetical protein